MNIKATRLLLYAFTICSALSLLVFVLWTVSSLEHAKRSANAMAVQRVTPPNVPSSESSENPGAVASDQKNSSGQLPKEEPTDSAIQEEVPSNEPLDLAASIDESSLEGRTEPSRLKEEIVHGHNDDAAPAPLVLRPISEATVDGHIVASQPVDLDVGPEFRNLLDAIRLSFAFNVLPGSADRAAEVQGLAGHLRLDFVIRDGLPDVATAFRRDPTLLNGIPLRIGRGELALFEAIPDLTRPTKPQVASAVYADFTPVNLVEALLATGSAIDAPIWIEVDGNRTDLTAAQTQHVLDVLAEAKRQHLKRWHVETDPMLGLRYNPR